jgi:mannose-6-phosphate isomerase-like protein (cupin superfamily)
LTATAELTQTVLTIAAEPHPRATGDAEEVLFVLSGQGTLKLGEVSYELEPESGAYLAPGEEYTLIPTGDDELQVVHVRIPPPIAEVETGPRNVVRRLADQVAEDATADRQFRIVADPSSGLRSATQFVGSIPPGRAPDHFHTYDEVIYVLDGTGAFHGGGRSEPVRAGARIELPARQVHCLENSGAGAMRVVAVFRPAGSPAAAYYPDGTPAYSEEEAGP